MKLIELFEDVNMDMDANNKARAFVDAVVGYCLNKVQPALEEERYSDIEFQFSKFNGSNNVFVWIPSQQLGLSENFRFMITASEDAGDGGCYSVFGSGIPYICLKLNNLGFEHGKILTYDDLKVAIKQIIFNTKVHTILKHEYIHYLDSFRNKTMMKQDDDYKEHGKEYYNSPIEFNAYYHNVADVLMNFINMAQKQKSKEAILNMADIFKIDANFQKMLERCLEKSPAIIKRFYEMLTDKNKKALYKRLYKLHQKALEIIKDSHR